VVDAQNMPMHDAAWGLSYTCRGNATRVTSYLGQTVTSTLRHNIWRAGDVVVERRDRQCDGEAERELLGAGADDSELEHEPFHFDDVDFVVYALDVGANAKLWVGRGRARTRWPVRRRRALGWRWSSRIRSGRAGRAWGRSRSGSG
jgi:hypothetical protein